MTDYEGISMHKMKLNKPDSSGNFNVNLSLSKAINGWNG